MQALKNGVLEGFGDGRNGSSSTSSGRSSCSSKDYTFFCFKQSRKLTLAWGIAAAVAYTRMFVQQYWEHHHQQAEGDAQQLHSAVFVDMLFSLALACSSAAIACSALLGSAVAHRWSCTSLGFSCSCWYFLGLYASVRRSEYEVFTTFTFCAVGLVHVPHPVVLLGTHAAAMSCYFAGVGYNVQTSILRAMVVHGIGLVLYAVMGHRNRLQYKASVTQQQQQQQQQQPRLTSQSPHSHEACRLSQVVDPQKAGRQAVVEEAAAAPPAPHAAAPLGTNAWKSLHSVPEYSSPSPCPPVLRHSNSLESSVAREWEAAWVPLSPPPFLSVQGWKGLRGDGRPGGRHLPWRSSSSVSDLGDPLSDTLGADPPSSAAAPEVGHPSSEAPDPSSPAINVGEQLRISVARVQEASSCLGTPATVAAVEVQGSGQAQHAQGALQDGQTESAKCAGASGLGSWGGAAGGVTAHLRCTPTTSCSTGSGQQPSAAAGPSSMSRHALLLEQLPAALQPGVSQPQRFSSCMASAWEVGGMFNRDGTLRGMPTPPPTLSAVSPMVTTPVDGCVMLRVVGAGLQRQGVELRARMHGVYYPVRVASVGPAEAEPVAVARYMLRQPSRSAEVHKSASSGALVELLPLQQPGSRMPCLMPSASPPGTPDGAAAGRLIKAQVPSGRNLSQGQAPDWGALPAQGLPPQQWQHGRSLEAAVITISGLKASSSAFRGLLTLECQVEGTLSSSRPVLVLAKDLDGGVEAELLQAFAADGSHADCSMEALAREQAHPERMAFDNCSGLFSRSDLGAGQSSSSSCDSVRRGAHAGGKGRGRRAAAEEGEEEEVEVEEAEGGVADESGAGASWDAEEGEKEGSKEDSWMADFVSDLGFWLECIDMLDEQHAAKVRGSSRWADMGSLGTSPACPVAVGSSGSSTLRPPLYIAAAASAACVTASSSSTSTSRATPESSLSTVFAAKVAPCGEGDGSAAERCSGADRPAAALPANGPDYMEQLPMLRGHPVPRAVLVMVGTQLLASALEQAMRTLAERLIQGLVKTLGIREEQVCTSVRTVSGGWSVLHCAVRSQDLATLEVALSLCGVNPTRAWQLDAAPAAPACTPLHMAAVLPDGGQLATAILARHPEVLRLWLGLPLEAPPPLATSGPQPPAPLRPPQQQQQQSAALCSTLTSPGNLGRLGSVTLLPMELGATAAAIAAAAASDVAVTAAAQGSPASPSPTAVGGTGHTVARVLLDPRPGSPAALAAACGNWVRTAWAQSAACSSPTSVHSPSAGTSGPALPASHASSSRSSLSGAPRAAAGLQQPGGPLTPLPGLGSAPAPTAAATAAAAAGVGAALCARENASSRAAPEDLGHPSVPLLQLPPLSRSGSKQALAAHGLQPPLLAAPPPQLPPVHAQPPPPGPQMMPVQAGHQAGLVCLSAAVVRGLGSRAQQLGAWARLLAVGFRAQEDAVVLGAQQQLQQAGNGGSRRGSAALAAPSAGRERSVLEARYMQQTHRGALLGHLLGVEGGVLGGLSLQHMERAWLTMLALRCALKAAAVAGLWVQLLLPLLPLLALALDIAYCTLFPFLAEQVRVRMLAPLLLLEVLLAACAHTGLTPMPPDNGTLFNCPTCIALQNLVVLAMAVVFERHHRAAFLLEQLQPHHLPGQQQQQQPSYCLGVSRGGMRLV